MTKIIFNKEKNGIEIHFQSKPNVAILDQIKASGFMWSRFNKCWYQKVNERALQCAAKFGEIPPMTSSAANNEADSISAYVDAQEIAFCDNLWTR